MIPNKLDTVDVSYKLYRRRWVVLTLYVLFCMANAMQWIQYAIIADVIMKYYDIPASAVNWTSLVYMLVYIILIFPATWLYNKIGLRYTIIMGSVLNCAGAWIKVASVDPDLFWVTLLGQTVVAMAQVYVMSTPATVAATWFGPDEVSTACAIGVFGMQFGNALGFLISPLVVKDGSITEIGHDLAVLFYSIAIFTSVLLILTVILVEAEPPTPPSSAQAQRVGIQNESVHEFIDTVKRIMRQSNYVLLFLANGINIGVFCSLMTFLNPMILEQYEDGGRHAGSIGVTLMAFGVTGAVFLGIFLDRTRTYKGTCLVVYAVATVALIAYTLLLEYTSMIIYLYIAGAVIGLSMISYIPAGYEFGAELTYPEAESTTASVLAIGTQVFAFSLTLTYGAIIEQHSAFLSNWVMVSFLILGTLLSAFTKSDLRRQRAEGHDL